MTNRFNPHDTRDPATVLRPTLHEFLVKHGVQLSFIAEQAGVCRQTASGVNSGRITSVTIGTQAAILETLMRIESGKIIVPANRRRPVGRSAVQAYGDVCGYGHARTPDNLRIVAGKRICKKCETRRRKQWEMRKIRKASASNAG